MNKRILFDSGFVVAFNNPKDSHHREAFNFLAQNKRVDFILPEVALTEITYLLQTAGGQLAATRFMDRIAQEQTPLQSVTHVDLAKKRRNPLCFSDGNIKRSDVDFR